MPRDPKRNLRGMHARSCTASSSVLEGPDRDEKAWRRRLSKTIASYFEMANFKDKKITITFRNKDGAELCKISIPRTGLDLERLPKPTDKNVLRCCPTWFVGPLENERTKNLIPGKLVQ
eukprot:GHVP01014249.1.p1 GENE.GHVP01014249.1~~GHVP01014249.1.p1  ORF type:complete len:119 (+),score=11.50 GHVP01014249.1:999-1355(+)